MVAMLCRGLSVTLLRRDEGGRKVLGAWRDLGYQIHPTIIFAQLLFLDQVNLF